MKPIMLTPELVEKTLEDMKKQLAESKLTDGEFKYSTNFKYKNNERAIIWFTPTAWLKMLALVNHNAQEIGWHGTIQRLGEPTSAEFLVTDILVYPQYVTNANVSPDQTEYQTWMMNLDDEVFNTLHFQGHSHVNFGTSPSGTDLQHQSDIVAQLRPGKDFYAFLIYNKRGESNKKIYDLQNNILYEDGDIDLKVQIDCDLDAFIKASDTMVKQHTPSYTGYGARSAIDSQQAYYSRRYNGDDYQPIGTLPASRKAPRTTPNTKKSKLPKLPKYKQQELDYMDDNQLPFDDEYDYDEFSE